MKDFLKSHYVGLTAGVIATVALVLGMNNCSGNSDCEARVDDVAAQVDSLATNQASIIEVVNGHKSRIKSNSDAINSLKSRMSSAESNISDLQDSIAVHRTEIDSLKIGVDSIAKLQQKCPAINPKAVKKTAKRPARPNNAPVCRDTARAVVPGQVATGCGSNQNAAVSIGNNSSNNTIIINNGGAVKTPADTVKTTKTTRTVTGHCSSTLTVTTYVTNGYCM